MNQIYTLLFSIYLFCMKTKNVFGINNNNNNNNNHIHQILPKINNQNIVYPDEAILFHQSELCREDELKNDLQCFKEVPDDNYEVLIGENVLIKCLVANQKGKAQWRFGDRMLGFNRKIPFKLRFSMIGDEEAGDQSLKIENVTVSDAGEYECQVTRGNYGKKELRKATRLTILVPPSVPMIYENNNKQPSTTVLITISAKPNENFNKKLNIKCLSKGGLPDPTFEWFHNSQQLRDQELSIKIIESSFQSQLVIGVTQLINGDILTCAVHNKATLRNSEISQHKLKVSISIVVNTLPGAPKIIDVSNKIVINEDKSLSLSCRSQPAGEPPGSIKWDWTDIDKKQLDNSLFNIPKDWIHNFIESGILQSRITIPKLDRQYHGLYLTCRLNHDLLEDQTDQIQVLIEHGPKNITIDSSIGKPKKIINYDLKNIWTDVPVLYAKPKEKLLLQCSTSKYFGDVNLSWFIHEDWSTNTENWKLIDSTNFKENTVDEVKRKLQISYLEIIHSAEKYIVIKCEMSFQSTKTSSIVIVETIKLPSIPVLKFNKEFITDNSEVTISCFITGGNPIPSLKLYKGNQEILNTFQSKQDNKVELKYKFYATKLMNLDKYSCSVTSTFRLFENIRSKELVLKVLYPPTKLDMSSPPEMSIRSGSFSTFTCKADESNPAPEITWIKYHCKNTEQNNMYNKDIISKCVPKPVESTYTIKIGKWNGSFIIESNVKLLLTEKDNNNILQCSINLAINANKVIQKIIKLNVRHPPTFKKDIQYDYVVTEGQPIIITLLPIANPPVQIYQWLSEGSSIPHSRAVRIHENTLNIIRSDVDMMRNYTLTARNEIGIGSFTFRLNVTFGARMIGPDIENIIVKFDDKEAKLICKAQSNPTGSQTKIIWTMLDKAYNWRLLNKESRDIIDSSKSIHCNGDQWISLGKYRAQCSSSSKIAIFSILQISNLVPSDMGRYQCLVNNTIESAASKILNLKVPVGARVIYSRRRQFSGGELGQSAKLFCWIFGFPKPKITWYRDTSNLTLISGKKFSYDFERLKSGLYNSILTVDFLQKSDFTNYFCQASNDMGTVTNRIQLITTTKPDIPYGIRVTNTTENSITIEWIQGFNGGFQQDFTITWRSISIFNSKINSMEITENILDEKMTYSLMELIPSTQYEIRVCSKNKRFENCQFASPILMKTLNTAVTEYGNGIFSTKSYSPTKERLKSDNIVITITSISVFVFVILVINILFVSFYIRKRRNKYNQTQNGIKMENSLGYMQCSNMEMYPALNTNTRGSSINEISTNNSQRSLDSIKNSLKHNIDQRPGSMVVTSPNHRVPGSMTNYIPNLSTSICYPTNMLPNDRVLMYPSLIDGNPQNRTSPSHTLQSISPGQSSHNSHLMTPYASLLHRHHTVNSQGQVENQSSLVGTPLQLSPIRSTLVPEQTCVAGGLLIPVNHLSDHVMYGLPSQCPELFPNNHSIYQKYNEDRLLSNDIEKIPNNLSYSLSYSGTIPHHHRQAIYSRNDAIISASYELNFPKNQIYHESQISNIVHMNDSASNSSSSSNVKRYGELSPVYSKPFNSDDILFEDKMMQSFEDEMLDTAV